jgi:hypothetical protein
MGIFWIGVFLSLGLYLSISLSSILTHKILQDYDLALLVRLNLSIYTIYLLLLLNNSFLLFLGLVLVVLVNKVATAKVYTLFKDNFQMMFVFCFVLSLLAARIFELILGSNTKIVSFLNFWVQNKISLLLVVILLAIFSITVLLRSNLFLILLARQSGQSFLDNLKIKSSLIDSFIFWFGSFWTVCFCLLSVLFASVNSQFSLVWLITCVIINSVFEGFKNSFYFMIVWSLINSLLYLWLPSQLATMVNFGLLITIMTIKMHLKKK